MKYKVENNVPMPPNAAGAPVQHMSFAGQLRALKKGQSIFVTDKTRSHVSGAGAFVTKKTGQKYASRAMDGGVRIWRVS